MTEQFTQTFFLSAGETNPEQEMALPILVTKIIDIATAHANSLGIGNPSMADRNCGWVLSRLTIEMTRWPRVNDTYSITTWIESWNRHFSERAFCIRSDEGEILGYARSIWMVMSTINHENAGLSHLTLPEGMIPGLECPIARQKRHRPIMGPGESPDESTSGTIMATHPATPYRFKYCDLDSYRHVNTVRYVDLLLNQFTLEDFDKKCVRRLELSFLHEARYGMSIDIMRADSGKTSSFSLRRNDDRTPLLFARIELSDRE